MNLRFVVDEKHLLYELLSQDTTIKELDDIKEYFWHKYHKGYSLLLGRFHHFLKSPDFKACVEEAAAELLRMFSAFSEEEFLMKLLSETNEYKIWLSDQWDKNKGRITKELTSIMKTDLPKDEFKVIVTSNKLHCGHFIGDNTFVWGHSEDWSNYSLVYLCHEYLHGLFGYSDLEHAIIELIADQELRLRLNNGGEYFTEAGMRVGHKNLQEIEKTLLLDWRDYLQNKTMNVFEFAAAMKKKHTTL